MSLFKSIRIRRCAALLLAGAAAVISLLVAASRPAEAGFPGTNGPIAFVSDRDSPLPVINDDVYVTDETGATPIRLTSDPQLDRQPAVSPNGKEIAFYSTRNTLEFPNPPVFPNPRGDFELYVMDTTDDDGDGQGDNLRRLTDNLVSDFAPAWSPEGKKIAFASIRGGNTDVYVMDADVCEASTVVDPGCPDPEVIRLTNDSAVDQVPVFSPDGSKIAFQSARDGNQEIYLMNADGTGAPTNLTNNPALDSLPDFSPSGQRLTFGSNRDSPPPPALPDVDIWTMNIDGSDPVNLTPTRTATNDRWSSWSPDGTKIAFWSGIGAGLGSDAEIWTVPAGGGTEINLTSNGVGDIEPDWGRTRRQGGLSLSHRVESKDACCRR